MPDTREKMRPRVVDFSFLIGSWEVIDCGLETAKGDSQGVAGTTFQLSPGGDVTWKLPENYINLPVFASDAYEAVVRGPFLTTLIRFGSYKGHVIEFRIEKFNPQTLVMTLHEGLLYMICKKLTNFPNNCIVESPFSLWQAFEEGYFTDLCIVANNDREFRVHTCILKILAPNIDWNSQPPPFSGLPPNVINPIIHYLYTYSLPPELTVEVAEQVIVTALDYPGLDDLIALCRRFIKNVKLAREMSTLINEVHALGIQAAENFAIRSDMHSIREPAILCNAVRNAIRDVAVAVSKMLLFCDVYNKRKNEFSPRGGYEIIRFTRSRIPCFVNQVNTFMQVVKATFGSLSQMERHELARYLLPEMGNIFDIVIHVLSCAKEFFDAIMLHLGPEDNAKYRLKMHNFNDHMERINHKKEVSKMRFILHRIECLIHHLKKKRDRFRCFNIENKIRSLTRNIDHLIDRLPFLFLRLEEITEELEQKCEWIESQFCFKMSAAKVGEFIRNLIENKGPLRNLLSALCDIIQRDGFTQSVIALGILDRRPKDTNFTESAPPPNISSDNYTLNIREFVRGPPPSRINPLSINAFKRLRDSLETDMILHVVLPEASDEEEDDRDIGEYFEDDVDSANRLSLASIRIVDAEEYDAFSTDRRSDCKAIASTETESAGPNDVHGISASLDMKADRATTGDTKIKDSVLPEKQADGTGSKSEEVDAVSTGEAGDARAKGDVEDPASFDKKVDGTANGSGKSENAVSAGNEDSTSTEKGDEGATSLEEGGAGACAITDEGCAGACAITDEECAGACAITDEGCAGACAITDEEYAGACAITEENGKMVLAGKPKKGREVIIIRAHRAIIATRCSLFRKALLSGMQEDINRKIEVHNINMKLFNIFLNFMYTGVFDYSKLSPRQISDLFLIADCYEVESFKQACEKALKTFINDNSVLLFLNMADTYSASILKDACKKYISGHPSVSFDNLLYDEMPKKLKGELYDLVIWGKDKVLLVRPQDLALDGPHRAGACAVLDAEADPDTWDLPRADIEDCVPSSDSIRFRWAFDQLREIVGHGVPRTTLVQILLAADSDLNRALNYYYSSS